MHLVGHHRFAVAGTAEDNAAFAFAARNCFRCRPNKQRVIDRFFTERAEVFYFVAQRAEEFFYFFLIAKTGVI